MVVDLRSAHARYPRDDDLGRLIGDLTELSPRFAELWPSRAVAVHSADRKQAEHPEVGRLELDCDVLTVQGADLRIIAYTAEPGSEAAQKLALVWVTGLLQLTAQAEASRASGSEGSTGHR